MTDAIVLLVMVPEREVGLAIARATVAEGLAAAANLLGEAVSVFHWQGRLHEMSETPLLLTTRVTLQDALIARVTALHPYELPGIVALPIVAAGASWLAWLEEVTLDSA